MTFIEDMQKLSKENNREIQFAQSNTEAFITGLDAGREVGEECFVGIPSKEDVSYDEVLIRVADDVGRALLERGGVRSFGYTDPRDIVAYGLGGRIGLLDSFNKQTGVTV